MDSIFGPLSPEQPSLFDPTNKLDQEQLAYVEAPYGKWVTEPPYTLAPGTTRCPVPTCPGHKRTYKPYWRLNEHMKMKHGWPRKQTQPNLDKRMGNTFRAEHRKRSSAFTNGFGMDDTNSEGDVNMSDGDGEPAEEVTRPRRSGAKKDYSRLFDPYITTSPTKTAKSLMVMLKVRVNDPSTHDNVNTPDVSGTATATARPSIATKVERAEQPDYHILTEAEQYVAELEMQKETTTTTPPAFLTSPYSPAASHVLPSPAELASTLRNLLRDDQLRINTLITPERSGAIRPIYHALSQRAESIASMQASAPTTPQAASTTSQSSISPPPGRLDFSVPFTFGGPRTTPFEWEMQGQQQRKRRRVKQDREFKSSPLVARPQPVAFSEPSPVLSKQPPVLKTGIKLVLKMTPAKQEIVEELYSSDAEAEAPDDTAVDDDYDPDETVPVIVGYYGQRHD